MARIVSSPAGVAATLAGAAALTVAGFLWVGAATNQTTQGSGSSDPAVPNAEWGTTPPSSGSGQPPTPSTDPGTTTTQGGGSSSPPGGGSGNSGGNSGNGGYKFPGGNGELPGGG